MEVVHLSVLVINSGSSSLKASLFLESDARQDYHYKLENHASSDAIEVGFQQLFNDIKNEKPLVVGHRFVHGGNISDYAREIDEAEYERLTNLVALAPLHMPSHLIGVDLCALHFDVPQIACFDTAFHSTMAETARRLPIPSRLNLCRYGYHGINYAHVARLLPQHIGDHAYGKVVVAHLGAGASLCLMDNLVSVDTTMGYSTAGGVPMSTRSGDLDPGALLALADDYSVHELEQIIFHQSGLLALSDGESADMETLLSSKSEHAVFAVDYFCRQISGAIGALAGKTGGIDALVFTAGIGEHSALIRQKICEPLAFLGFSIDTEANDSSITNIEAQGCKPIAIVAADEAQEIAHLVKQMR